MKVFTQKVPFFGKKQRLSFSQCRNRRSQEEVVRSNSSVTAILDGSDIVRVVSVPDRLVNFVIRTS